MKKTVFLVRHGEAVHNVCEKEARASAAAQAEANGLAPGSEAHGHLVEAARKAVLKTDGLWDAELSEAGRSEAAAAREEIKALVASEGDGLHLPWPTAIYSSPLQRTLQTTAIIFPGHPGTHIREFLRERRTGLPCDERHSASALRARPSFMHMSSTDLQQLDAGCAFDLRPTPCAAELEDSRKLRERTAQISEYLRGLEDSSVCFVTHKGFLRELERGPLGRPEAPEFRNCEVRAYEVLLQADGTFTCSLRYPGHGLPTGKSSCRGGAGTTTLSAPTPARAAVTAAAVLSRR